MLFYFNIVPVFLRYPRVHCGCTLPCVWRRYWWHLKMVGKFCDRVFRLHWFGYVSNGMAVRILGKSCQDTWWVYVLKWWVHWTAFIYPTGNRLLGVNEDCIQPYSIDIATAISSKMFSHRKLSILLMVTAFDKIDFVFTNWLISCLICLWSAVLL